MEYQIIRSSRRTVALVVEPQGNLVVRAPRKASVEVIERFIKLKARWIERQQQDAARFSPPVGQKFADGEMHWFLGVQRPLRITAEYRSKLLYRDGQFLLSRFQAGKAKRLFEDWYRRQARELLPSRAAYWAGRMGVTCRKVTITGARTRWGSCSSRGTINFSWRLVKAPLDAIDYVVVHELAHLTHHDHSKKFWTLVERFFPNFRVSRHWLNRQGRYLAG